MSGTHQAAVNQSRLNRAAVKNVAVKIIAVLAAALAAVLGMPAASQAANLTWGGGGADDNWSTTANWASGTAPVNTDVLFFGGETRTSTNNDLTNLFPGLGTATGNTAVTFSNDGSAGNAGQFTLSGNKLLLGGNVVSTQSAVGVPLTSTIALDMEVKGGFRNITAGARHSIEVSGVISADSTTRGLTTSAGASSKVILSGLNTLNFLRLSAGTTSVNTLFDTGVASAGGTGGIQLGYSSADTTLEYTGAATSTNRTFSGFNTAASNPAIRIDNNGTGTFTFTSATFNSVLDSVTATRTFTLGGTNNGVIEGVIQNNNSAAGVLALTKADAGTWTLGGANTYTGATTVNAGSLFVNGNQTAATGTVNVAATARLGGTGTLGGATAVSGVLAPGVGGIGTLTVANNVTWNGGGNWLFELGTAGASIGNPGTADLLSITGNNDFLKGTGSSWGFDFGGSGTVGWYKLADWTGGTTTFAAGDFTATNLGSGYTGEFTVQDNGLYIVVVPEPGTWALAGVGIVIAAGVAGYRRRHRLAGNSLAGHCPAGG